MSETGWSPSDADLAELWSAALQVADGTMLDWRVVSVETRPEGTSTVAASVTAKWADGSRSVETLAASVSDRARSALRCSDGTNTVGVWRYPFDPALPALARATDPSRMARLVGELGLGTGPVTLTPLSYRPGKRAVIRVDTAHGTVFAKVLRPGRVGRLHQLHVDAVREGSPVARSLGWCADGLLMLDAVPGRSLRDELLAGDLQPAPARVVELLDCLPARLVTGQPNRTWSDKAPHYAAVLGRLVPELAADAAALAASVAYEPPGDLAPVAVHGDFYETQVQLRHGRVSGLLDLDTAGAGDRYDDPACLLGHLAVLAQVWPDRRAVIDEFAAGCLREFERRLSPEPLRKRVAAVVLSLATGPHRVRQADWQVATRHRLELGQRWLACCAD